MSFIRLNSTLDTLSVFMTHTGLSSAPTSLRPFVANAGQANAANLQLARVDLPANAPAACSVTFTGLDVATTSLVLRG